MPGPTCPRCGSAPGAACRHAESGRAVRWHRERRAKAAMIAEAESEGARVAAHLLAWAERTFPADQVGDVVAAAADFVAGHPEVLGPPRLASWPEVWALVQRKGMLFR